MTAYYTLAVIGGSYLFTPAGGGGVPEELLTNGSFATASDWTLDTNASISGGALRFNSAIATGTTYQSFPMEYQNLESVALRITVIVTSIAQGAIVMTGQVAAIQTAGTHIFYRSSTSSDFEINTNSSCDAVIASISCEVLTDAELGPELIINGSFADASGWTITGDDLAISGGKLNATNATTANATNDGAGTVNGAIYKSVLTVSDYVEGEVKTATDDGIETWSALSLDAVANGTSISVGQATEAGTLAVRVRNCTASVDNVSIKKYT